MRIHVASSDQALAALGFVEARSGAVNAAEAVLESLAEKARTCYVPRSGLCAINIALRRLDRAAEEWTLARAEGDGNSAGLERTRAGIRFGARSLAFEGAAGTIS